jgi:predicted transcriptional regulator
LRKKKYQTEQLERTEASLDTVEKLIQDLEYSQIETKVFIINIILMILYFIKKKNVFRLLKALKLEVLP